MVVFDTSIVAIAFDQDAAVPNDPKTKKPIHRCRDRIDALLGNLATSGQRVLIPTPVVTEYMFWGGPDKHRRLDILIKNKAFVIAPFDLKAAIECAEINDGDKGKSIDQTQTKAKIRFDRQIIAIAIARGAQTIYTGDENLGRTAKRCGLEVVFTWDLPPPPLSQMPLGIEDKSPVDVKMAAEQQPTDDALIETLPQTGHGINSDGANSDTAPV